MSFWSSQRLEGSLHRLVGHTRKDSVDCNAITMRIGGEIYITPGLEQTAPSSHTKQLLGPTQPIAIPPGRFAFLLTEEVVTIPVEVMGFISMKATFKSKGLVNVSGFHVDPGWNGPLIFAVFNAGPATVHLQRGMPLFLLWIADLEEASKKRKDKPGPTGIPPVMINNITGVVDSIYALEKRLKDDLKELREKDDSLRDQMTEVKERQTRILMGLSVAAVIGSALVGVALKSIADYFTRPSIPIETSAPLQPGPPPSRAEGTPRPVPGPSDSGATTPAPPAPTPPAAPSPPSVQVAPPRTQAAPAPAQQAPQ
jgi:dCTP deaminase